MNNFVLDDQQSLPNFLIVGANKAGTTSLAYYCSQHPDIFIPEIKEPMFFTSTRKGEIHENPSLVKPYFSFTLKEYSELFSQAKEPLRGEASTSYLANPSCALWINKIIPDSKIIAVIRNPIERAFSSYKMYHGNGIEKRTFEKAIIHEMEVGVDGMRQGQHYLKLGMYSHQLSVFRKFFPDEQLFIGDFGRYNDDTIGFLKDVYNFLGVNKFVPPDLQRLNTTSSHYGNNEVIPSLDRALSKKIAKYFESDINTLQKMVEFDVLNWLTPSR